MNSDVVIDYAASPTGSKFHLDDTFVRGVVGPIGSGKSAMCVMDVLMDSRVQKPGPDGIRRTRFGIIRNTYRELIDTTIQTFRDWIPAVHRSWVAQDMKHIIRYDDIECEVLFRALDRPDDVKKLLSLELTSAWVNEAKEVPLAVIEMLVGRVGRFPPMRVGGPTRYGVIMDTNPPDTDHWWYRLFEEERPEEWKVFHQPSGIGPDAENINNLPPKYYQRLMSGKKQSWIDVFVHGKYGFVQDGKPIYPEYNDAIHASDVILEPNPELILYVGLDFGLTPAAVFGQESVLGQWRMIDEVVTERMGAKNFGKMLGKKLRKDYAGYEVVITGDPAGDADAQTDEQTVFEILAAAEIFADPAVTNDFVIRREAVADKMTTLTLAGEPAFIVSPKCRYYRKGLAGGYCFKRMQVTGDEKFKDKPDKNSIYSHVCDAGQYLLIGAGEGYTIVGESGEDWNSEPKVNEDLERCII